MRIDKRIILEVCCSDAASVRTAARAGAPRVEFCSALELDGLTPSFAQLRQLRQEFPSLRIHVLIRPRAGSFCYSPPELELMCAQVREALACGADGLVLGCLTPGGDVDMEAMRRLMAEVRDGCGFGRKGDGGFWQQGGNGQDGQDDGGNGRRASVTFHRAFDRCREPLGALEDLIALGCDRVLSSGQAPTAEEGIPLLQKLVSLARGRISVMPGGGVTPENLSLILRETGAREIHGSFRGRRGSGASSGDRHGDTPSGSGTSSDERRGDGSVGGTSEAAVRAALMQLSE